MPTFVDDVVLPGFDRRVVELEKEDLTDPRYKVNEAYLACPRCRKEMTVANLANPDRRQWSDRHFVGDFRALVAARAT